MPPHVQGKALIGWDQDGALSALSRRSRSPKWQIATVCDCVTVSVHLRGWSQSRRAPLSSALKRDLRESRP
jgi:hypothetical protein